MLKLKNKKEDVKKGEKMGGKATSIINETDLEVLKDKTVDITFVEKYVELHSRNEKGGGQIWFFGEALGTAKNRKEYNACMQELIRILNNDKDSFIQIQELRSKVKNANMHVLIPEFLPIRYQSGADFDCIVHEVTGEPVMFFDAQEILDIAISLNNGRSINEVMQTMLYNEYAEHTHIDVSEKDFLLFEKYYSAGKLNRIIKFICERSESSQGFVVYKTNTHLYYRNVQDYIRVGVN